MVRLIPTLLKTIRPTRRAIVLMFIALICGYWAYHIYNIIVYNIAYFPMIGPTIKYALFKGSPMAFIVGIASFWFGISSIPLILCLIYLIIVGSANIDVIRIDLIIESIGLSAVIYYAYRLRRLGGPIISLRAYTWTILGLMVLGLITYTIVLGTTGIASLVSGSIEDAIANAPITLKEFYGTLLATRAGALALTAVAVVTGVWVSYTLFYTIAQTLTLSPKASANRITESVERELRSIIAGETNEIRTIKSSYYFAASLIFYPIIALVAASIRNLAGIPDEVFQGALGWLLTIALYMLAWVPAKYIISSLPIVPGNLRGELRAGIKMDRRVNLRTILSSMLSVIVLVSGGAIAYAIIMGLDPLEVLKSVYTGSAYRDPLSILTDYIEGIDPLISGYINRIDRLLGILVRILWGG